MHVVFCSVFMISYIGMSYYNGSEHDPFYLDLFILTFLPCIPLLFNVIYYIVLFLYATLPLLEYIKYIFLKPTEFITQRAEFLI